MNKDSVLLKIIGSFFFSIMLTALTGFFFLKTTTNSMILLVFFLTLLFSALTSFTLVYFLVYKKIQALAKFSDFSESSEGDLTKRMPVLGNDELATLAKTHNIFVARIHKIIFKLKNIIFQSNIASKELASQSIQAATALEEINKTSLIMLDRENNLNTLIVSSREYLREIRNTIARTVIHVDSQSACVTESSAAVEQTIASIRNIDKISHAKTELALTLNQLAAQGGADMQKTREAMQGIAQSASLVTDLISVINEVAEKTTMLAMNAAIEAAHAGDHGKGFSVVADEIKSLAEKTTESANEISLSLSSMVSAIESSQRLTVKTDESIKQLIGGSKEVSESFSEISLGLSEMSAGTSELTTALEELVGITQDVTDNSKAIDDKAAEIDSVMGRVIGISQDNTAAMEAFASQVLGVKKATDAISQAGSENAESISIVDQEITRFTIIDTSNLRSSDGQTLVQWNKKQPEIPSRPLAPETREETDSLHWYDLEFAGWHTNKVNIPESPADGARNKRVVLLESCDHPYHTSYKAGCQKLADAFGVRLESYNANYSPETQSKQVDLAIRSKPDLILLTPTSVQESTAWFKKINKKNIPVIGSNTTPNDEGFQYILGWTGPNDWGQFRLLAREFAEKMNYTGGYGIVRHAKGNSNYFSRTWSIITELKSIAPQMKCLVMETAINEDDTQTLVSSWLAKYGNELAGICFSDPADGSRGLCKAVDLAERKDIVIVSSGNSAVTQELVKAGKVHAITWQSAEADGALAMEMAIDWFNGIEIEPIRYLPMKIITASNVAEFYPSQW